MARTVALGTISQAILDAQVASSRVPYIRIKIDGVDYSSRLLYLEHPEEVYRDHAVIGLSNRDGTLDALDLDGETFKIAYGYVTGNNVAEPFGNGATAEYTETAPLWVKSHQVISVQGERIYQIYAEGSWMRLREQKVIAGIADDEKILYGNVFPKTYTVYGLINLIIEGAMGWDLVDSPPDDGIIDTFRPVFELVGGTFESAARLLDRLIQMTKCFLRVEAIYTNGNFTPRFRVIYPEITNAVDETYYSWKAHWFTEHNEKSILLIPNSIVLLANNVNDGSGNPWDPDQIIVGTAKDDAQIAKYVEIVEPYMDGSIDNQKDADDRAVAILSKLKAEILGARTIIPHDAQVELYDKVAVLDKRT